ncbi:M1 family metallopeptidase [Streptomyces sp. TLI_146]|uniref:M1 family metallopeptidase n=1 Tax=Streptomyces sp. TLI_146 TaxID=1938858 RepID=UPI000C6FE45A|nr:M1 family metallopeptidase [Streptomyces sp. TLI_146]PKV86455.1 peptidase M1-like protein [Streptomyces sp. TLI_146]
MDHRSAIRRLVLPSAVLLALGGCTGGVEGKPGAAGVRDGLFPKLGNGGYDVEHYSVALDYDPARDHLTGSVTLDARATRDLSAFNLDFAGMEVTSATVGGERADANRAGTELTLRPADEIDKGARFRTTVAYSGTPKTLTDQDDSHEGWLRTADGALALGEPAGSMAWFPSNNHPSDKATYDMRITVPAGLKAVSNGELKSTVTAGGRTTFTWHTGEPMASYAATVAIGKYDVEPSKTPSGIPVYTAVDPAARKETAGVVAQLPEIVEWAKENFGPYPFSSTGVIVAPEGSAEYALETQNRPVIPADQFDTETLVHELAHQWFGDSVTPKRWKDMWLNEGFATYAEWLWSEDHGGRSTQAHFDEQYAKGADAGLWAFPPAEPPSAAEISHDPVYQRGAMVIHKIRRAVGDDAFYDIVQGWTKRYRHANASTEDFTRFVEEESGEDLTDLWDTWLYGDGKPKSP